MTDEKKKYLLEKLRMGFVVCQIPPHCRKGLELYLTEGTEPGSFLTAVLSNDLMDAVGRADHINIHHLPGYARLIYNDMPHDSHGSREKVEAWLARFSREEDVNNEAD